MGKEKNAHHDHKLTTSGKYQKCLPYFDNKFFIILILLFFDQPRNLSLFNSDGVSEPRLSISAISAENKSVGVWLHE